MLGGACCATRAAIGPPTKDAHHEVRSLADPLLLTVGIAQAAEPAPGTEINALMRVMKKAGSTLIAQPGGIHAEAGKLTTVWTQPFFFAGRNPVRVVLDADGVTPVTGWVRVEVAGTCAAVPVVVWVKPCSGNWNALLANPDFVAALKAIVPSKGGI